jgi:hypothetical protein
VAYPRFSHKSVDGVDRVLAESATPGDLPRQRLGDPIEPNGAATEAVLEAIARADEPFAVSPLVMECLVCPLRAGRAALAEAYEGLAAAGDFAVAVVDG